MPPGHNVDAIRILGWHENQDGIFADLLESRRVVREHLVGKLNGTMRGSNFGRVNRTGHQNDVLALCEERLGLIGWGGARISQTALDLEILVKLLHRLRRTDDRLNERPTFGSFSNFLDANTGAGFFEFVEV